MKYVVKSVYAIFTVAMIGLALLFLGTKVDLLGYQVKVVKSGSMEPSIATGGIVIIAPQPEYKTGDVITFGEDTARAVPVTHRIVEMYGGGRQAIFTTKGDANEEADRDPVRAHEVIGKVVYTVPYVGMVIDFARTPLGFALLIGFPALVIILDEFASIVWEVRKYFARKRTRSTSVKQVPQTTSKSDDTTATLSTLPKEHKRYYI